MNYLLDTQVALNDMTILDIALSHTFAVAQIPFHHRDPFDRILIAQSLVESLPLISIDGIFDRYGIDRLWV